MVDRRGITKTQLEQLFEQIDAHHEGLTSCEVCGWIADTEIEDA